MNRPRTSTPPLVLRTSFILPSPALHTRLPSFLRDRDRVVAEGTKTTHTRDRSVVEGPSRAPVRSLSLGPALVLIFGREARQRFSMPAEPAAAAGSWGLPSLTGFLDGSVLNVFASSPADKEKAAGEGDEGRGASPGTMLVQTSKPKPLPIGVSQQLCGGPTASSKPRRTGSNTSVESDLPELGRLERYKTPTTSVATSDEEPACRGSEVSSKNPKPRLPSAIIPKKPQLSVGRMQSF